MKFFIYKIENLINQKRYVGITQNPTVRKNRHFSELRKDTHPNRYLQNAYNKYGKDNFIFEIIDEFDSEYEDAYKKESLYIKSFGDYPNGYNMSEGGLSHRGQNCKFNREEIFEILMLNTLLNRGGTKIASIFNVPRRTIANIISGVNYHYLFEEFEELSEEHFMMLQEQIKLKYNIEQINSARLINENKLRRFSKEEVFAMYYQEEFKVPKTKKELMAQLNIKNYSSLQDITSGKTYKDYYYEYHQMTKSQKDNASLYRNI